MNVVCAHCGAPISEPHTLARARRGKRVFCNRVCFGLSRRNPSSPSEAERKALKQAYDSALRYGARRDELLQKKRSYYYDNREQIATKHAVYRHANMARHVEYCRRPEYKEYKSVYDMQRRDKINFGAFADAAMVLRDIEKEIMERMTRYEIYLTNGTINKAQMRRRAL